MSYEETLSTELAFRRYEEVRHRFPLARFPETSVACSGLVEIADQFDAFLLDSFGVLNVGTAPFRVRPPVWPACGRWANA